VRIAIGVTLALCLGGVAFGALGPRYGGDLAVGVLDLPASPEPSVPRGMGERLVAGLIHETLVGIGTDGVPVPALARGWKTAVGGREWTLQLREGATFHDDRPLAGADVVRSLRRFLRSPSVAGTHLADELEGGAAFRARTSEELPGLAAPEAGQIVIRLDQPRPLPLAPLAALAAAITGPSGEGCGPFVPTLSVPGKRAAFTAFGGHVRGRAYLDSLQLLGFSDPQALRGEFQAGKLDVAPGPGGPSALAATVLLVLDTAQPPFSRGEARAAVAAAIDRGDLVANFLPGGDPSPSLLVPSLLPSLGLEEPAAAGTLSGTLSMLVSRDVPPLVSQRVVAYLGTIGLQVTVAAASPAAVSASSGGARLMMWSPEVAEAGLALEELAALAGADPTVRETLSLAGRETDLDRRRGVLHRAEAALRSTRALLPLAAAPVAFSQRRGIHDLAVGPGGRLLLDDAWIEP